MNVTCNQVSPSGPTAGLLRPGVKLALAEARHIRGQQPDCPVGAARGMEGHTVTRILVVEDDEFMAEALVSMLQTIAETNTAAGAELCLQVPSVAPLHACLWDSSILTHLCARLQVEHTTTGESAWDLLSSRRFDIALVDVKLPGITGLDLSWCYASSFSEGVTVHDTIMIACTSEIDPAALYEHATPVTRGPSPRRRRRRRLPRRNATACRPALPRRRQRCFCALLPAHTPLPPPRAGMASRTC